MPDSALKIMIDLPTGISFELNYALGHGIDPDRAFDLASEFLTAYKDENMYRPVVNLIGQK